MAKLSPGIKLIRSLAQAAKSQRKMATRLLAAATPKSPKPPKRSSVTSTPLKTRLVPVPVPALPGQWLMAQHPIPGRPGHAMRCWLYLPHAAPSLMPQGWPLVVMLHGCHQDAVQFAEGSRMNRLAESKGYAVLYPEQPISAHAQRCWRWYDRATQQGGGDTALLADLIRKVCADHLIDRRRIYACGLSAGAGMAAVLALNHPELIAAVGLHSAPVFGAGHSPVGALQVMRHGALGQVDAAIAGVLERHALLALPASGRSMPAILIQGENDQVVRPVNQDQLARQWLQLNGLPAGPAHRVTVKPAGRGGGNAHDIHDYLVGRKLVLRVARIAGLGHAWSGGDPALKFNAKAGPDASRMMLDFFCRHRRLVSARR